MSSIDTCEKCGKDYNIKTVHQCLGKMRIENLKKHFTGATYELTQEIITKEYWQLEMQLAHLADSYSTTRKQLIEQSEQFNLDVRKLVLFILEKQVQVLKRGNYLTKRQHLKLIKKV